MPKDAVSGSKDVLRQSIPCGCPSGDCTSQSTPMVEPPLTTEDVARVLGINRTIARARMRKNEIRSFKVGGQWRAFGTDVAEYLMRQLSDAERGRGKTSSTS